MHDVPPMPPPPPPRPATEFPHASNLASFRNWAQFEPTESIQKLYERSASRIAMLEAELASTRPLLRILAVVFAARLKARDPFGCGLINGIFYRAHKDGSGVRREKEVDPRWTPQEPGL